MVSVNLIPRDRLTRKRRRARLRMWIALCSAYALILTAGLSLACMAWGSDDAALGGELHAVVREIEDSQRSIDELRGRLSEAQATLDASDAMANHPDWSALLVLLARQLGDDVVLGNCLLTPSGSDRSGGAPRRIPSPRGSRDDARAPSPGSPARDATLGKQRYGLKLSGFGRTQNAVSQFVLRLERIELFHEVRLIKCNRQPFLSGHAVAFEVECSM